MPCLREMMSLSLVPRTHLLTLNSAGSRPRYESTPGRNGIFIILFASQEAFLTGVVALQHPIGQVWAFVQGRGVTKLLMCTSFPILFRTAELLVEEGSGSGPLLQRTHGRSLVAWCAGSF